MAACVGWTGDVVSLQADSPDLAFNVPDAGCTTMTTTTAPSATSRAGSGSEPQSENGLDLRGLRKDYGSSAAADDIALASEA